MAISVNWATGVISIPKADTTLLQTTPTEIRELDINVFRLALKDLEDDAEGMAWPDTHRHAAPTSVGGVTLARVVELINGYTVTFEDGQYAVNLVGANSNIGDNVNVNQVSVRSANSAGLVQSREIEIASFEGAVHVDPFIGVAGTVFPTGTHRQPVSNMPDALLIAQSRGLSEFSILSTLTLTAGQDYSGYRFTSQNRQVVLNNTGATLTNCKVSEMILIGDFSSPGMAFQRCALAGVTIADAFVEECLLNATVTVVGTGPNSFFSCVDGDTDDMFPKLDLANFTGDIFVRQYYGSLEITNCSAGVTLRADMNGMFRLAASVTGGDFLVRGVGSVVDASTGTTVNQTDLVTNQSIVDRMFADARALSVGKFLGLK